MLQPNLAPDDYERPDGYWTPMERDSSPLRSKKGTAQITLAPQGFAPDDRMREPVKL